jgi:hypothetical protein
VCGPNSNFRLLKLPEDKQRLKAQQKQKVNPTTQHELNKKDSWKNLENTVTNDLNAIPTYREAKRQIRSGALWFMPGDVDDTDIRIECKERDMLDANGKKTFSVKKDILDKIIDEAKMDNKFPGLVFRYKGEKDRYAVLPWEELLNLIHLLKVHYLEVTSLKNEVEFLKNKLNKMEEKA